MCNDVITVIYIRHRTNSVKYMLRVDNSSSSDLFCTEKHRRIAPKHFAEEQIRRMEIRSIVGRQVKRMLCFELVIEWENIAHKMHY